jgi:uncharacterized protein (TIGR02996 family)
VSNDLNALLAHAAGAFARSEEAEALQPLLEAWRESRAERIAGLVRLLSDRVTTGLAPIDLNFASAHRALLQPEDLPRLVGSLLDNAARGREATLCQQLDHFRQWPADPRLIPPLLAIARMPVVRQEPVLRALCDLLMHLRDPHSVESLRTLLTSLPPQLPSAERLHIVIRLTASQELPTLDEEARARCDALKEAIEARTAAEQRAAATRDALRARVYAHPDDDSARLVLADLLLELGDPLGEFLMLQCGPSPDAARISRLLTAHRAKWEAPLGGAIEGGSTRFERGFPVAVRMNPGAGSPLPEPGPAWGTVREIDWNWGGPSREGAAWLAHPHLHGVTRLRRVKPAIARRLGQHPLPVQWLEMSGVLRREAPEAFTTLSALPHLRRVEIPIAAPEDVLLCATSPLARRLEYFEASMATSWKLEVTPAHLRFPVQATLMGEGEEREGPLRGVAAVVRARQCEDLAAAIRGAVGFSTRGILIRCMRQPDDAGMAVLRSAASAYSRIEWEPAAG